MRTRKVCFGGTSRLGTETEALPPGVTSCAVTIRLTPRTRLGLALCSVRVTSRSSTTALPRWLTCDSPRFAEIRVNGESGGRLIFTELSSGVSCAHSRVMRATNRIANLLDINVINRYVARVGIQVTGLHGSLRSRRIRYVAGAHMLHAQSLPALIQFDTGGGSPQDRAIARNRRRRGRRWPLQDQTRRHERHHAGASRQRARAGQNPKRGEGSRGSLAAHAFAGRQAQPDIGFHLGGQPVPDRKSTRLNSSHLVI